MCTASRNRVQTVPDPQTVSLAESGFYPNPFPRCIDPNCGCAACLHRCTQVALAGGIPTNGEWWKVQGVFPVVHGGVAEQVDGFFAQAVA